MSEFETQDVPSLAERAGPYLALSDEEAAYLAGIIDGEGTIGIHDLQAERIAALNGAPGVGGRVRRMGGPRERC